MSAQKGSVSPVIFITIGVIVIAGGLYFANKSFDLQKLLPNQSSQSTPSAENTTTSNTQINNSTLYEGEGYTINLPNGWNKSVALSRVDLQGVTDVFSPLDGVEIDKMLTDNPLNPSYYLEVNILDNPKNITAKDWVTNTKYSPQGKGQIVTETTLNEVTAVKVVGNQGKGYIDYYLYNNGKIYNIGDFYSPNDPTWPTPSKVTLKDLQSIVESFKLNNSNTSPDFKAILETAKKLKLDYKSQLSLIRQVGDYARLRAISTEQNLDPLTIIMVKKNGAWEVLDFGTAFPELEATIPALFK